jgi:RNA polymerase sigma-70 factor (ECF subfamily)
MDDHGSPGAKLATEVVTAAYRDHGAAIRRIAQRMTRDDELAADITQDAFLRLFLEIVAGRVPQNIAAWLYRTSSNRVISHARHEAVVRRSAHRLAEVGGSRAPDDDVVCREGIRTVRVALAALPPDYRGALVLAGEGTPNRDIAHRLGRSETATRTLLCRARRRLRDHAAPVPSVAGAG